MFKYFIKNRILPTFSYCEFNKSIAFYFYTLQYVIALKSSNYPSLPSERFGHNTKVIKLLFGWKITLYQKQ